MVYHTINWRTEEQQALEKGLRQEEKLWSKPLQRGRERLLLAHRSQVTVQSLSRLTEAGRMMSLSVGAAITSTIDWMIYPKKHVYFSVLKASKSKTRLWADLVSDADEHLLAISTGRERSPLLIRALIHSWGQIMACPGQDILSCAWLTARGFYCVLPFLNHCVVDLKPQHSKGQLS